MKKIIAVVLVVLLLTGCGSGQKGGAIRIGDFEGIISGVTEKEVTKTPENSKTTVADKEEENPTIDSGTADTTPKQDIKTPSSPETSAPEKEVVKKYVTIAIDCKTILSNKDNLEPGYESFVPQNGMILTTQKVEITGQETVMDVLKAITKKHGIAMVERAGYVSSIYNIDEKACGTYSGWMYSVNGEFPNVGASQKTVTDGMSIRWRYTCTMGDL